MPVSAGLPQKGDAILPPAPSVHTLFSISLTGGYTTTKSDNTVFLPVWTAVPPIISFLPGGERPAPCGHS